MRKYDMKLKRLFTPININGMELKNRIVMVAMQHLYTENGAPTEKFSKYYWRRAEGGAGLVVVGACRFDDYGAKDSCMSLCTDELIPGWKSFNDGMHERGCKVAVQLFHAGRYMPKADVPCGDEALAPSAVYSSFTRETAREMTITEIGEVVENWAAAAVRAKKAGFDAVEIIGSVGYLIPQFLSPITNLRTDEYGGSFQNRCRFPLEVICALRAAAGPNYPIILRMSGSDLIEGSNTNKEQAEFAKLAEKAGVDMLSVTGGWHESKVPQLTGDAPQGSLSFLAKGIKDAVGIPVIAATRVSDPVIAEEILALGHADLIGMGRSLLADPDLPRLAQEGRFSGIRPCTACNQGCLAKTFFDKPIQCMVNGLAGREFEIKDAPADTPANILVLGGGPAGCAAAIEAAQRGHRVTLWEKTGSLGGKLRMVSVLPGRQEFEALIRYYEHTLEALGVTVELGKIATATDAAAGGFDHVIVAVGALDTSPKLPIPKGSMPMYTVSDLLSGEVMPGKNVVVTSGDYIGCETARHLLRQASLSPEKLFYLHVHKVADPIVIDGLLNSSDRTVTIVTKATKIGTRYEPGTSWPILADLKRLGVKSYTSAQIVEIGDDYVLCEYDETKRAAIPCDTLITSGGTLPNSIIYDKLRGSGIDAHLIGDAARPAKAIQAIQAGAWLGATI